MFKRNTNIITKKRALFFTDDVTVKKALALSPFNSLAGGLVGGVIGGKIFNTSNVEGVICLQSDRLTFETGNIGSLTASHDISFEILLKDINSITTGRRALVKTMIIHSNDCNYEFSIYFLGSFIKKIEQLLG